MSTLIKKKNTCKAICLNKSGKIRPFKIPYDLKIDQIDTNKFPDSVLNHIGRGSLSRECDFEYNDNTISIFGFVKGNDSNVNKTELPPPLDNVIFYGNIFAVSHNDGTINDLTPENYSDFYDNAFGGFEDLGSEDSWSEEEEPNSDDEKFIAPEGSITEDSESSSEEWCSDEEDSSSDEQSIKSLKSEKGSTNMMVENKDTVSNNSKSIIINDDNDNDNDNVSELSDSLAKSSELEDGIFLEECAIIDEYLGTLDKRLLFAPSNIKDTIFKFHGKYDDFLRKWFQSNINTNTNKIKKKIYKKYKDILFN